MSTNFGFEIMTSLGPSIGSRDNDKSTNKQRELRPIKGKIVVVETSPEATRRLRSIFYQFEVVTLSQADDFTVKSALLEHPDCSLLMIQKSLMIYHRPAILGVMDLLVSLGIPVLFHEKNDITFSDKLLEKAVKAMGLWG
ncbi:MAG: hypothetical protein HYV97_04245 [Bdellovibrio sp.]|nr:hypothetical protein [Bdellovibrio sp.]